MITGLSFFEFFLRKIAKDISVDVTKLNRIRSIIAKFEKDGIISQALANTGHGVEGARVISDHGIEKKHLKCGTTPL